MFAKKIILIGFVTYLFAHIEVLNWHLMMLSRPTRSRLGFYSLLLQQNLQPFHSVRECRRHASSLSPKLLYSSKSLLAPYWASPSVARLSNARKLSGRTTTYLIPCSDVGHYLEVRGDRKLKRKSATASRKG
jgi:hypothetical protein